MRESFDQVYKFRQQYKTYLDAFARMKATDFEDLEKKKFEDVNTMYLSLVKLNDWLCSKMSENLAENNEVTIYEVSCTQLNRQLISEQEDNKKRLAKFIESRIQEICNQCEEFYNKTIAKLSIPMTSIDDFSTQRDNIAEINTTINDITERITMMNMIGELLPDLKNIGLRKKV